MKTIYFNNILIALLILLSGTIYCQTPTRLGEEAGTQGDKNTFIGYYAGHEEEGAENVFLGYRSGDGSEESYYNVFLGSQTGRNSYEGEYNTFVGYRTGVLNSLGGDNTFLGSKAGTYNTTGSNNVFLGSLAGYSNVNGGSNVYLGMMAGYYSTGSNNVFVGDWAGYSQTGSNKLWIKDLIYGEFDNDLVGINGKLGIGITNPNESLEIFRNSAIQVAAQYGNSNTGSGSGNGFIVGIETAGNGLIWNREDNFIRFGTNGSERLRIASDGKVGIGTSTPSYKLDVCGTIRAKEIKVDLESGCDFVFRNDYNLISLNELEQFVRNHQHLPGIAPEKEMIENGVNMKEMQMKLLQKIEELTLYTIELNKELENLQARIKDLEQK